MQPVVKPSKECRVARPSSLAANGSGRSSAHLTNGADGAFDFTRVRELGLEDQINDLAARMLVEHPEDTELTDFDARASCKRAFKALYGEDVAAELEHEIFHKPK